MSAAVTRVRQTSPFGPTSKFYFPRVKQVTNFAGDPPNVPPRVTTLNSDGLSDRRGIQITESEGHAWPRKGHDLQDRGGPFYTRKVYIAEMKYRDVSSSQQITSKMGRRVDNDYISPVPVPSFTYLGDRRVSGLPDLSTSDDDLAVIGTSVIASVSPVSPMVSLPVTIGELIRDGLPTMAGLKILKGKGKPSSVADEYLNTMFGIKPLLSDLQALGRVIQDADKLIAQLKRDSGKVVRRRRDFDIEKEVIEDYVSMRPARSVWTLAKSVFPGNPVSTSVAVHHKTTVSRKRSFSGAFTYYLPDSSEHGNIRRMASVADRLVGLKPDVSDVWNLLPWSWLGDWFVNTGDVIQNAVNAQSFGQVVQYAYMMEHTIVKYEYTVIDHGFPMASGPITLVIHDEVKKRVAASPYGFGSVWEEFTPYQLSILAALGISRTKPIAR